MKTFETEKNNIPEGATHYQEPDCEHIFAWFKLDGDKLSIKVPGCNKDFDWDECKLDYYKGKITPIPKPENTEWNGEGLPPVGEECEFKKHFESESRFVKCFVVGETKDKEWLVIHCYNGDELHFAHKTKGVFEFRKPESPEEKERRERLEAAEELHDIAQDAYFSEDGGRDGSATWDKAPDRVRNMYLAIVDKTNYRKGE